MNRAIITLVMCLHAGSISAGNTIWSDGTAAALPEGRWEVGIFQPLRYGLNESVELSSHVLTNFLMPNATLKKVWTNCFGLDFTTVHSLTYPTPLLNVISREGTGGILPANTVVPHIITLNNQVLVTFPVAEGHTVTPRIGFASALKFGNMDMTTIDLPLIYTRTSVYHNGWLVDIGIDLNGRIVDRFYYWLDLDKFIMPAEYAAFAYEHKGMLIWRKSAKFSALIGYKLVYSDYPSALQRRWDIFPLVDLMWGRN